MAMRAVSSNFGIDRGFRIQFPGLWAVEEERVARTENECYLRHCIVYPQYRLESEEYEVANRQRGLIAHRQVSRRVACRGAFRPVCWKDNTNGRQVRVSLAEQRNTVARTLI
jgi:hypothetical protein